MRGKRGERQNVSFGCTQNKGALLLGPRVPLRNFGGYTENPGRKRPRAETYPHTKSTGGGGSQSRDGTINKPNDEMLGPGRI